jgi:phosphoglycerate dehydrogenase-like enzyme
LVPIPKVTANSLIGCDDLLAISRYGVGYDSVDVAACMARQVLVTMTSGAVDRPVVEAMIGWMLALTHRMLQKDRLVRTGRWDERSLDKGCELRDRTLGVIGLGGIGRQLVKPVQGFQMRQPLAYDPFVRPEVFQRFGVHPVRLEALRSTADFVSLHYPLNERTRGLIGAEQLKLTKSEAYLLNLARGGIGDEDTLYKALAINVWQARRWVVLLAPHSIAWTKELFRDIARTACQSLLDISLGRRPRGVVNPELLESPRFQEEWQRVRRGQQAAC